jgi:DNA-binding PadR family transcriptional regulator
MTPLEVFMSVLRSMIIGFMVTVVSVLGAESLESPEIKREIKEVQIKILKNTSNILIQEFENSCNSNISDIKYFNPAPARPEGYGNTLQYYTKNDKIRLMNQLTQIIETAKNKIYEVINNLEKKGNNTPYSDEDIVKNFKNIYGILNEGRKNCALALSQIEKQQLKTQTLKESQAACLKKNQAALKESQEALNNCQADLAKKKPSRLSQAKNFVGLGKKKTEDTPSTPSPKKEVNPDKAQESLIKSLQKNGLM